MNDVTNKSTHGRARRVLSQTLETRLANPETTDAVPVSDFYEITESLAGRARHGGGRPDLHGDQARPGLQQVLGRGRFVNAPASIPTFENLIPRAEAIMRHTFANAPIAVRYALEAVNGGMQTSQAQDLLLEAALFGVRAATEDKAEGTTAFLAKRAPDFQGR